MAVLQIRVTPRSSRNKVEVANGAVKVWVTAPPVDGEANEAVIKVVAKHVGLPPSRVTIVAGHTGRDKTLEITGMDDDKLRSKLGLLDL